MPSNLNKKNVFLGLLILFVTGAALFFFVQRTVDSEKPIDFAISNHPDAKTTPGIEDMGTPVVNNGGEEISREMMDSSMPELNERDRARFLDFLEISQSGRDNDPRLDTELRSMSPELKTHLQNYYRRLAPEKRNERGLVSFLIARDAKTVEDLDFLREVLSEEPCLSMADCKTLTPKDPHMSGVDDVSLNYPQLALLYQLEKQLETNPQFLIDPAFKAQLRAAISKGVDSSVSKVREKAEALQKKYSL